MRLVIGLTIALASLTACQKKPEGATCAAAVDNMMAVTKQQMTGHGDLEVQNRTAMIEQCEKRNLSGAQRTCLATAKDLAAIAACTPRPAQPKP